jgi:hypothetical protein
VRPRARSPPRGDRPIDRSIAKPLIDLKHSVFSLLAI